MASSVSVGDKVTTNAQQDYNGTHLASFVYNGTNVYDVIQVGGRNLPDDRIVIGKGSVVTAAVKLESLTIISSANNKPETPINPQQQPEVVEPPRIPDFDSGELANKIGNLVNAHNQTNWNFTTGTIDGSAVQYTDGRFPTSIGSDPTESYNNSMLEDSDRKNAGTHKGQLTTLQNLALDRSDPSLVQNNTGYPKVKGATHDDRGQIKRYQYDYFMDYWGDKLSDGSVIASDMDLLRKSINIDIQSKEKVFQLYNDNYNKYKIDNPNDALSKTFSHVFFVRPDCNIFKSFKSVNEFELDSNVKTLSEFYYASKHSPELLAQLTQSQSSFNHQFMMYLSNKVQSFSVQDEYITNDTYGRALTGYKIPYGKTSVESRGADSFSIKYIDDRDLHIYNLHKLWTDYIDHVYRGKLVPLEKYNLNKVLDYATCVYYIVCAEDGETVIFWTKYWGVFPVEAPSSSFSYTNENKGGNTRPDFDLKYQYAWKEDFNPLSMVEFNMHSRNLPTVYTPHYQPGKLSTGYTWSGAPFIETFNTTHYNAHNVTLPYTFKLRFRPMDTK